MKQERLNLYLIDMKYIRNLHRADNKVSSVSPQIGKQHRIYVGIIVLCNNRKYLIPLSHAAAKHTKMKPRADFDKIFDRKGKLIGVLNYNLMIPVEEAQIYKVNLKPDSNDSASEHHYKQKANCLHNLCRGESGYKGKARCLDFGKLEQICDKYNSRLFSLDSVSIFFFMQQMEKCCTLIRRKPLPYTILEADAKEVGNEY